MKNTLFFSLLLVSTPTMQSMFIMRGFPQGPLFFGLSRYYSKNNFPIQRPTIVTQGAQMIALQQQQEDRDKSHSSESQNPELAQRLLTSPQQLNNYSPISNNSSDSSSDSD